MVKSVLRVRCSPYYAHLYLDLDLRLRKGEKFICLIISQNVVVERVQEYIGCSACFFHK